MTRSTWVCCSMTSETKIAYGSRVLRQGRSRPFARNQAKSARSTGERLLVAAAPEGEERVPLRTLREHPQLGAATGKREFVTRARGSGQPRALSPAREPDLLTMPEAAEGLRVSPSTLDRLRAQGEIAWVPVGRQMRFWPEAIADYVKRAERACPGGEPDVSARPARLRPAPAPGPRRSRARRRARRRGRSASAAFFSPSTRAGSGGGITSPPTAKRLPS